MILTKYEIEVLNIMLKNKFDIQQLDLIIKSPITGYDYTGAGYFLEITNDIFSVQRNVISEPTLIGKADNFQVGFILFIENKKLVIECHSWGIENLPSTIRNQEIEILVSNENWCNRRYRAL